MFKTKRRRKQVLFGRRRGLRLWKERVPSLTAGPPRSGLEVVFPPEAPYRAGLCPPLFPGGCGECLARLAHPVHQWVCSVVRRDQSLHRLDVTLDLKSDAVLDALSGNMCDEGFCVSGLLRSDICWDELDHPERRSREGANSLLVNVVAMRYVHDSRVADCPLKLRPRTRGA